MSSLRKYYSPVRLTEHIEAIFLDSAKTVVNKFGNVIILYEDIHTLRSPLLGKRHVESYCNGFRYAQVVQLI